MKSGNKFLQPSSPSLTFGTEHYNQVGKINTSQRFKGEALPGAYVCPLGMLYVLRETELSSQHVVLGRDPVNGRVHILIARSQIVPHTA